LPPRSEAAARSRVRSCAGLYVIAPLPAGTYRITASAAGFRSLVQEQIVVDALSTVELNLTLEVGATAESVTVSAAPPELNTSDARLGQTIRNDMYTALPLAMGSGNPRNPAAFIYLMPGVHRRAGPSASSTAGRCAGTAFSSSALTTPTATAWRPTPSS
jgi:hypothetical protein